MLERDIIEADLQSNDDYQIECVLVEPDSVHGQDKSYTQASE